MIVKVFSDYEVEKSLTSIQRGLRLDDTLCDATLAARESSTVTIKGYCWVNDTQYSYASRSEGVGVVGSLCETIIE